MPADLLRDAAEHSQFSADKRAQSKAQFEADLWSHLSTVVVRLVDAHSRSLGLSSGLTAEPRNVLVALDEFGEYPHLIRALIAIRRKVATTAATTSDGLKLHLYVAAGGTGTEQLACGVGPRRAPSTRGS